MPIVHVYRISIFIYSVLYLLEPNGSALARRRLDCQQISPKLKLLVGGGLGKLVLQIK